MGDGEGVEDGKSQCTNASPRVQGSRKLSQYFIFITEKIASNYFAKEIYFISYFFKVHNKNCWVKLFCGQRPDEF